jgi:predicted CopG family antitoxin
MKTTIQIDSEIVKKLDEIKIKSGFGSYNSVINALLNNVKRLEIILGE